MFEMSLNESDVTVYPTSTCTIEMRQSIHQGKMVEVEPSLALDCEIDVDEMVTTREQAD